MTNYRAQVHDELNLNVGDYISATEIAVSNGDEEGWIYGSSLTTGASGYFPSNHVLRAPESEAWSLHTRIQFVGSGMGRLNDEPLVNSMRQPEASLEDCARAAIDSSVSSYHFHNSSKQFNDNLLKIL